jgi:hypothetical protein
MMVLEDVQQAVPSNLQATQQRTSVKRYAFLSVHVTCMPLTRLAVCVDLHQSALLTG